MYLSSQDVFVGACVSKMVKERGSKDKIVKTFLDATYDAYKACGMYLQMKVPLTNHSLQALSAIDPEARGHSLTCCPMKKLKAKLRTYLSEEEEDQYDLEVQNFQTDQTDNMLPVYDDGRADMWYADVFIKYPTLGKDV